MFLRPSECTLQPGPETLDTVRVHLAIHPLFLTLIHPINDYDRIPITRKLVREHDSTRLSNRLDHAFQPPFYFCQTSPAGPVYLQECRH